MVKARKAKKTRRSVGTKRLFDAETGINKRGLAIQREVRKRLGPYIERLCSEIDPYDLRLALMSEIRVMICGKLRLSKLP